MAKYLSLLAFGLASSALAQSEAPAYGQCGGATWQGPTQCVSGYTCVVSNEYYSQCLPGSGSASTTAGGSTRTATAPSNDPTFPAGGTGVTGTGRTTRYWDCCKPSCAWSGKAPVSRPVNTCGSNNQVLSDLAARSGCDSNPTGTAFMCANQAPWAVSDNLAYGFAAVRINGQTESQWCCACYELTMTSGPATGKRMVVQAINTGGDLGSNHFDIGMPGGGVGIFNGCSRQYNAPTDGWGARYGGVGSRSECSVLPEAIREGCHWRWDWWNGSDNPDVRFREVTCPSELTSRTGCVRNS